MSPSRFVTVSSHGLSLSEGLGFNDRGYMMGLAGVSIDGAVKNGESAWQIAKVACGVTILDYICRLLSMRLNLI